MDIIFLSLFSFTYEKNLFIWLEINSKQMLNISCRIHNILDFNFKWNLQEGKSKNSLIVIFVACSQSLQTTLTVAPEEIIMYHMTLMSI